MPWTSACQTYFVRWSSRTTSVGSPSARVEEQQEHLVRVLRVESEVDARRSRRGAQRIRQAAADHPARPMLQHVRHDRVLVYRPFDAVSPSLAARARAGLHRGHAHHHGEEEAQGRLGLPQVRRGHRAPAVTRLWRPDRRGRVGATRTIRAARAWCSARGSASSARRSSWCATSAASRSTPACCSWCASASARPSRTHEQARAVDPDDIGGI